MDNETDNLTGTVVPVHGNHGEVTKKVIQRLKGDKKPPDCEKCGRPLTSISVIQPGFYWNEKAEQYEYTQSLNEDSTLVCSFCNHHVPAEVSEEIREL